MPNSSGLYYFAHGADVSTRPPLVLIHGAGGHHLYWPPQLRRLHGERVFALDLPGHGKSGGVGHHTIEAYCDEVLRFLDESGLRRAVLAGHSMGGAVALQAAIRSPGRALGLVLFGSAARLHVNPRLLHLASDPKKAAEAVHLIIENSFAEATSQRLKDLAEQRMLESRASVLYGDLQACEAFDASGRAAGVAAPTLVLFGSEDRMVTPASGRVLAREFPQGRFELLPDAGHMLMLEQPEVAARLVQDFLGGLRYVPGE